MHFDISPHIGRKSRKSLTKLSPQAVKNKISEFPYLPGAVHQIEAKKPAMMQKSMQRYRTGFGLSSWWRA
jgi:hypothetical protein